MTPASRADVEHDLETARAERDEALKDVEALKNVIAEQGRQLASDEVYATVLLDKAIALENTAGVMRRLAQKFKDGV